MVAGETGRGGVSASIFVFVSNSISSCSFGSSGGDGGRLMSAGCIIAVASMLAAEDEMEGRTRRDVCQHEGDAEKRVESE